MSHFKGIMRNKKGLTLVEVVVAMGLFGVIMVTLFPAFLITNLMNITSSEFTDANFEAQSELEEIYSRSKTPGITPSTVLSDMGYGSCTVDGATTTCTKNEISSDYIYSIEYYVYTTFVYTIPDPDVVVPVHSILITASSKLTREVNGSEIGNDRAQLQVVLRFGESFTP